MSYNNHTGGGASLTSNSHSDISQNKKQKSRPTNSRILALLFAGIFSIAFVVMAVVMVLDFTRESGDASPLPAASLFNTNGTINAVNAQLVLNAVNNGNQVNRFRIFPDFGSGNSLAFSRVNWHFVSMEGNRVNFIMTESFSTQTYDAVLTTARTTIPPILNTIHTSIPVAIRNHMLESHNLLPGAAAPIASTPSLITMPHTSTLSALGGNWNIPAAGGITGRWLAHVDSLPGEQVSVLSETGNTFSGTGWNGRIRAVISISYASLVNALPPAPVNHTVTFNLQGGTLNGSTANFTQEVLSNRAVQRPVDPTRAGHTFLHWSTSATQGVGNTSVYDFGRGVTANVTLNAVWVVNPVAPTNRVLTMHRNNALIGANVGANTTANIGQGLSVTIGGATIPSPTHAGLIFLGWAFSYARANSQIIDLGIGSEFIMPNHNQTIFAVWQDANAQFAPRGGEVGGLVHLNGVGGSTSEFQNTWFYNPLNNATMQLPTTTYMNGIFRENNPDFMSRTFDGWVMQVTHMTGTITAGQRFTRIPQYTNNALTAGEVEFFARWV